MSIYTLSEASLETNLYLGERNIYGSSRLGTEVVHKVIASSDPGNITMTSDTNRFVGDKLYEISNHLGNVLEVITDRKLAIQDGIGGLDYYSPDVVSYSDYYPGGMLLPGRHANSSEYRFGYQGSEMDNEIKGEGNVYSTFYRLYDSRTLRWFSVDPVIHPYESPYVAMANNPTI